MNSLLQSIENKQRESARLINTLQYYEWLKEQGIGYNDVVGVAKLKYTRILHERIPKLYRIRTSFGSILSLKLVDGSVTYRHYPPFDDMVVFNRSYLK